MNFRPCIDIHDGKVKQIVGSTLNDKSAVENFVSSRDADYFASLYMENGLKGGHIILLNKAGTEEYELTKAQAIKGLKAFPGGMQIGGGITADNASEYTEYASHVIVTSYVFKDGNIDENNLKKLVNAVGREKIVLDLSCRKADGEYYITTDRWQKMTNVAISFETLEYFAGFCDEFLIHAVDVEGKQNGIELNLVEYLAQWDGIPVTYAGGVRSIEDMKLIKKAGNNKIDVTVGSALDLFGGKMKFTEAVDFCK